MYPNTKIVRNATMLKIIGLVLLATLATPQAITWKDVEEETPRLIGGLILNTRIVNVETVKTHGDATTVISTIPSTKIANAVTKKTIGDAITATWILPSTKIVSVEINNDLHSIQQYILNKVW